MEVLVPMKTKFSNKSRSRKHIELQFKLSSLRYCSISDSSFRCMGINEVSKMSRDIKVSRRYPIYDIPISHYIMQLNPFFGRYPEKKKGGKTDVHKHKVSIRDRRSIFDTPLDIGHGTDLLDNILRVALEIKFKKKILKFSFID